MKTLRNKLLQLACFLLLISFLVFNVGCNRAKPLALLPIKTIDFIPLKDTPVLPNKILSLLEKSLKERGLTNIADLDSTIVVQLQYATENNFMNQNVYGSFTNCYLQTPAAQKLAEAQQHLTAIEPQYKLLVFDCCRPRSVQKTMWKIVKNTPQQRYVAPPTYGSQHNYGVAVDLSIADENGQELDMGTPFDFLGPLAEPRLEQQFLREGKLNKEQIANRHLLKTVMKKAGFRGIAREWWHFEAFSREYTRATFEIVE